MSALYVTQTSVTKQRYLMALRLVPQNVWGRSVNLSVYKGKGSFKKYMFAFKTVYILFDCIDPEINPNNNR